MAWRERAAARAAAAGESAAPAPGGNSWSQRKAVQDAAASASVAATFTDAPKRLTWKEKQELKAKEAADKLEEDKKAKEAAKEKAAEEKAAKKAAEEEAAEKAAKDAEAAVTPTVDSGTWPNNAPAQGYNNKITVAYIMII